MQTIEEFIEDRLKTIELLIQMHIEDLEKAISYRKFLIAEGKDAPIDDVKYHRQRLHDLKLEANVYYTAQDCKADNVFNTTTTR